MIVTNLLIKMNHRIRTVVVACLFSAIGLTFIASLGDNSVVRLLTHSEARYQLYNDTPQSAPLNYTMYDPLLLRQIRLHVSRPTPGRRAILSSPPALSTGNFNGAERLPGDVSQTCQSTVIDRLLRGRRNGFFIEAGAYDGITLSNSWFFETQRNWTGLLIEGNPLLFRSIIDLNRNAYVLRACVGTVERGMFSQMTLDRAYEGLSSLVAAGAVNSVPVICFPLNSIAAALGITHVDFLSLDVEGPELEIVETIDWTRIRFDVIMLEFNNLADKLVRLRRFFSATGLYRETAILQSTAGGPLDVVFQRLDLKTN